MPEEFISGQQFGIAPSPEEIQRQNDKLFSWLVVAATAGACGWVLFFLMLVHILNMA